MKRRLIIGCAAIALFCAGWWAARFQPAPHSQGSEAGTLAANGAAATVQGVAVSDQRRDSGDDRTKLIQSELRAALQGAAPERSPALLAALEKLTTTELTSDVVAVLDRIMEGGDIDECHYLLSVMEQKEDRDSVRFLVKQLNHPDADIRDRALIACESVAGDIFESPEQAREWAEHWTPDPQRQALFSGRMQDDAKPGSIHPGVRRNVEESTGTPTQGSGLERKK
jgi:hypothetical protein